jgi:hypothetical protein
VGNTVREDERKTIASRSNENSAVVIAFQTTCVLHTAPSMIVVTLKEKKEENRTQLAVVVQLVSKAVS